MTRDQRFRDSFDEFFMNEIKNDELKYYNPLRLLTKNTKKNVHEYILTIPSKYKICDITHDIFDEDGQLIHPRDSVYTDQVIPDFDYFETKFLDYFDKYRLFDGFKILSWTYVYNMNTNENNYQSENPSFNVTIDVCYYKNHSPYPIKPELEITKAKYNKLLKQHNDLMEENNSLSNQVEELHDLVIMIEQKNRFLHRKIRKLNEIFSNNHNRITNKVIELLNEQNKYEDCPVCYEKMDSETIIVPGCCHYICCDCIKKCENCPICREKYCIKCN
uniref:RING-type domain-containing protein n=1 Tax=viral metagenome TaxID=1070528 RepID=A0A6C0EDD0_9ZZZZ